VRHWPGEEFSAATDLGEAAEEIAQITGRQIEAVAREYPTYLPLTAGVDSRMLLACARPISQGISLYTIRIPDLSAETDCVIAKRIASRLNLRHEVVEMLEPKEVDLLRWVYRTSYEVADRRG
jgi:hypothetical protein